MERLSALIKRTLLAVALLGLTGLVVLGANEPSIAEPIQHLQATSPSMTGDELFEKLLEHNRICDFRLEQYSAVTTYEVTNDKGKVYAEEVVRVEYRAPDHKTFSIDSEKGSWLVRDLVFKRLLESESETSSGRAHRDSSIKPANYEFKPLGEENLGAYPCLVVQALPRRKDKYLFEGFI